LNQLKISIIQSNATDKKEENVDQALSLVETAAKSDRPDIIVLPELFTFHGGTLDQKKAASEKEVDGTTIHSLKKLAKDFKAYIHGGSLIEAEDEKLFNTTFIFSPEGEIIEKYRKIHLFDVTTPGGIEYMESKSITAGDRIVCYEAAGAVIGCSICYDIRFPELYMKLMERMPDIIMIPAAFTMQTGMDHWEALCRARAIELQCYVVAPNQTGSYSEGGQKRFNYGNSMIVDPWGIVIAQCQNNIGFTTATLDLSVLRQVQQMIPSRSNRVLI